MKEFRSTFANHLEFTIHGLDECEISPSPSPQLVHAEDEEISTELFSQERDVDVDDQNNPSSSPDSHIAAVKEQFTQLRISLAERGSPQESGLLHNLRAMKEEAWAKRKARKLRREMKRVQFQDDPVTGSVSFCRSCCPGGRNEATTKKLWSSGRGNETNSSGAGGESETNSSSGESWDVFEPQIGKRVSRMRLRPMAQIHSINMFENIIPRHILESRCKNPNFVPFSTPLVKMLADIG